MKRILFDYQAFDMQQYGGVSKLFCEIIPFLQQERDVRVGVLHSNNRHLTESGISPRLKPVPKLYSIIKAQHHYPGKRTLVRMADFFLSNRQHCIHLLKRQQFDLFEPTFFDPYFLTYLKGKPFCMEVHDMIPELYPEYYPSDDFQIVNKKTLCPRAAHIHVPSNKTKEDLVNILHLDPEKVTVISRGATAMSYSENRPFDFPYLLYVGARWSYKNFGPLLREFARIIQDNKEIRLVCTGAEFDNEELKLIRDLHVGERIHHVFPSDKDLGTLYHHAAAFVYSSEYEGFGLPILEAMGCGCPVMLNNASCFPEIAGDAAVYFEMKGGKSDFYEQFMNLWNMSTGDRAALTAKGHRRTEMYTWEETARRLDNIYETIV